MDKRHVFAVVLTAALLLFLPGMVSYAAAEETSATYQEAAWNNGRVTYTAKTAENCRLVTGSTAEVTWNPGWYVVNGSVTISEPITVSGAVNLILAEGCTLNAEKGIVVTTGNSLTIYAQSGGSGTLTATGTADDSRNASAGIGGGTSSFDSGAITIHGGVINATGGSTGSAGYSGAGIGGGSPSSGNGGSNGAVTIYGGTIIANSGAGGLTGAGIGGGDSDVGGAGNDITIYGGSVTAASTGTSAGGAGIGGGGGLTGGGTGSNIQIYGGMVHATGSAGGAGIGGGGSGSISNDDVSKRKSGDGSITISGGIVTAVGGQYAAGIGGGGGYYSSYTVGGTTYSNSCTGGTGSVTISGGIVDATGGAGNNSGEYKGAPIGNGGNTTGTAGVTKTAGIIFENTVGTVYGTVTIDGTYTIPAGYSLTIAKGGGFKENYAIYQDGRPIELEKVKATPVTGPAALQVCGHDGVKPASNGGGTHTLDCPYCGYTGEQNCAYDKDGPVFYTGEGEKAPTCTEEGLGHRECVCGSVMESGVVVKALGHEWQLTSEEAATAASEGKRVYTCLRCAKNREESIPKLPISDSGDSPELPSSDPDDSPEQPTTDSGNISREELKKNSAKLDAGISVKWKGNAIVLKWTKIAGAEGYDIFAAQSGKKLNKKSPVKTVKSGKTSASITKIAGKKISGKNVYYVQINPWKYAEGKKVSIGSSRTYYAAGKDNKKYTNVKELKPAKKKYTLKKGKSVTIPVTAVKESKKKKLLPKSCGPALRYESSNEKIVTVTSKGKVKAKKKGTCYISVTALNGVRTKIKITVK